jgi:hypothetical protein
VATALWRADYNTARPHCQIAWQTPAEFARSDDALEMLLQIEPLREQGQLIVHWPQGQSLRIAGSVDAPQLRVQIKRDKDWFAASGQLVVDELLQLLLGHEIRVVLR